MPPTPPHPHWKRVSTTAVRWFHGYANWLVGITWKRFAVLAILLMILASVLQKLPPFRLAWTEVLQDGQRAAESWPEVPTPPQPPATTTSPRRPASTRDDEGVTISIDRDGVRIGTPAARIAGASAAAASAASAASAATDGTDVRIDADRDSIRIEMPGASREVIRDAARAAREAAREAAAEAREAAAEARQDAAQAVEEARRDAEEARREARQAVSEAGQVRRTHVVRLGDFLTDLAFLWIVASAIVKATYKGRVQAEVAAAVATEAAESEQLKRQVVEARMAAMQAQVEPHFLFNTLASIDHLIETDPPRASQMQKNLIALLRASMPAMRENHPTAHTLGREMAVIRPYLEILKVRMEDRLQTEIDVPAGLLSADFPALSIQGLVENAIKHGLEPKAEGGRLVVRAEVIDGRLTVTVADTGLGFGREAATAGTGVGLANLRERLQMLYGGRATLTIAENAPSGTVVTITVPYQAHADATVRAA